MTELQNLTVEQLRKLVPIKKEIEGLTAQLEAIMGGESAALQERRRPRKMSLAARAAISAAQKARWAKVKAAKAQAAPKKRRKMSAASKAKMAAAARARWAKAKAAGKNRLKVATCGANGFVQFNEPTSRRIIKVCP
jgi:hypothetical protein